MRLEILLSKYKTGHYSAVSSQSSYSSNLIALRKLRFKDKLKSLFPDQLITLNDLKRSNFLSNQVFTETYKLRAISGFDEDFPSLQDYETWIRLVNQFGPALKTQQVLYFTYLHLNSITGSTKNYSASYDMLLRKHKLLFDYNDLQTMQINKLLKNYQSLNVSKVIPYINSQNINYISGLFAKGYLNFFSKSKPKKFK